MWRRVDAWTRPLWESERERARVKDAPEPRSSTECPPPTAEARSARTSHCLPHMQTRSPALTVLLLCAACSSPIAARDAGIDLGDASSDADLPIRALESAPTPTLPRAPVAAPTLSALATRLSVADGTAYTGVDAAAEPPAALLRNAARGRRARGPAPRVARSIDGRDIWVVVGRGASHWTSHIRLAESAPRGTRVLPVYDLPYEDIGFALVDDAGQTALLLPSWPDATPYALEAAPGAPTAARRALDESIELRWMKSCPASRQECLLYGPPDAVTAAVDPVEPPGGWSLQTTLHPIPGARALPEDARAIGDDVKLAVISPSTDEGDDARCGVWTTVGAAPVDVLEIDCYDDQGFIGGVFASKDLRVVWAWEVDAARVHFALLDARTGAHRGSPRTAAADSYYEVDCGNVWSSTRPIPVLDGTHVGLALVWSGDSALYFAEGSERGRIIPARLAADPFETDEGVSELPPVLRAGRCGAGRCLRPAR